MNSLVQSLFPGSLDIVGDVHGDIDALTQLMLQLGYDEDGNHRDERRLVFVGDLTDRGPDSPTVVERVKGLIENGKAQCVLGNHELNIMLGQRKFDNGWFFGEKFFDQTTKQHVIQHLVTEPSAREELVKFFATLPLVLQRDDVRVVHACWQPEMVAMASQATDVLNLYEQHRFNINLGLAIRSDLQEWQKEQRHQNLNPVKVLTSGLEVKVDQPFEASGRTRYLDRYPWWQDYHDEAVCFFGHYSQPYGQPRGPDRAICVDYGVAQRWVPKVPGDRSPEKWRLAAIRYPEMQIAFENGDVEPIELPE
jgi:hypothetical protein